MFRVKVASEGAIIEHTIHDFSITIKNAPAGATGTSMEAKSIQPSKTPAKIRFGEAKSVNNRENKISWFTNDIPPLELSLSEGSVLSNNIVEKGCIKFVIDDYSFTIDLSSKIIYIRNKKRLLTLNTKELTFCYVPCEVEKKYDEVRDALQVCPEILQVNRIYTSSDLSRMKRTNVYNLLNLLGNSTIDAEVKFSLDKKSSAIISLLEPAKRAAQRSFTLTFTRVLVNLTFVNIEETLSEGEIKKTYRTDVVCKLKPSRVGQPTQPGQPDDTETAGPSTSRVDFLEFDQEMTSVEVKFFSKKLGDFFTVSSPFDFITEHFANLRISEIFAHATAEYKNVFDSTGNVEILSDNYDVSSAVFKKELQTKYISKIPAHIIITDGQLNIPKIAMEQIIQISKEEKIVLEDDDFCIRPVPVVISGLKGMTIKFAHNEINFVGSLETETVFENYDIYKTLEIRSSNCLRTILDSRLSLINLSRINSGIYPRDIPKFIGIDKNAAFGHGSIIFPSFQVDLEE
jgi:hypothetical protein